MKRKQFSKPYDIEYIKMMVINKIRYTQKTVL